MRASLCRARTLKPKVWSNNRALSKCFDKKSTKQTGGYFPRDFEFDVEGTVAQHVNRALSRRFGHCTVHGKALMSKMLSFIVNAWSMKK